MAQNAQSAAATLRACHRLHIIHLVNAEEIAAWKDTIMNVSWWEARRVHKPNAVSSLLIVGA